MISKLKLALRVGIVLMLLGLVGYILFLSHNNQALRQEVVRKTENIAALEHGIDTLRDGNGRMISKCQRMRLTIAELEESREALTGQIHALGIKLHRVQSVSETRLNTILSMHGKVDTVIVYRDNHPDTTLQLSYNDGHVSMKAQLVDSLKHFEAEVVAVDTIIQVVERVPHRWCFFKWGTKGIKQVIRSSNPHTKIVYQSYIELE